MLKIIKHSFANFAIETNALKRIKLVKDVYGQLLILVDKPSFRDHSIFIFLTAKETHNCHYLFKI